MWLLSLTWLTFIIILQIKFRIQNSEVQSERIKRLATNVKHLFKPFFSPQSHR